MCWLWRSRGLPDVWPSDKGLQRTQSAVPKRVNPLVLTLVSIMLRCEPTARSIRSAHSFVHSGKQMAVTFEWYSIFWSFFILFRPLYECAHTTKQACPVDLTRTIAATNPNTDKATCRKLAFSVENILDPNKFCSRKESQNSTRLWLNGTFERDDRNHMDDDQSESQSG